MIAWNSGKVIRDLGAMQKQERIENRVADSDNNTHAYFSHGRNCKYGRNCIYDCKGTILGTCCQFQDETGRYIRAGPEILAGSSILHN